MTASTAFWFVPIMPLAIVKLILPIAAVRRAITRVLMVIGEIWVSTNTLILRTMGAIDWRIDGIENLRRDGWYLVVSNHQTWVDIVVLQELLNRRIPFLKFFIKQQLVWFPFLGLIWWAMDMPFMKRFSPSYLAKNPHMKGKDLETTRRACKKFRDMPTSILNFIEGTRFSDEKRHARQSPYRNLLQPRAGGLAVAVSAMGPLFTGIVDVTLVYPHGPAKFWDMCCGREVRVVAVAREIALEEWLIQGDYQNDRVFRKRMHAWLGDIWRQKDETIDSIRESLNG
jgi:1-acyl-sn-glycerol-3-phosphate acyltransferase